MNTILQITELNLFFHPKQNELNLSEKIFTKIDELREEEEKMWKFSYERAIANLIEIYYQNDVHYGGKIIISFPLFVDFNSPLLFNSIMKNNNEILNNMNNNKINNKINNKNNQLNNSNNNNNNKYFIEKEEEINNVSPYYPTSIQLSLPISPDCAFPIVILFLLLLISLILLFIIIQLFISFITYYLLFIIYYLLILLLFLFLFFYYFYLFYYLFYYYINDEGKR